MRISVLDIRLTNIAESAINYNIIIRECCNYVHDLFYLYTSPFKELFTPEVRIKVNISTK